MSRRSLQVRPDSLSGGQDRRGLLLPFLACLDKTERFTLQPASLSSQVRTRTLSAMLEIESDMSK
eukprot:COSAG06_NODE_45268_length_356_cov_0.797665_1_plen_64_part_01